MSSQKKNTKVNTHSKNVSFISFTEYTVGKCQNTQQEIKPPAFFTNYTLVFIIFLTLEVAGTWAISSNPKDGPSHTGPFFACAILARIFVISCHIEIKFGHPLCKIIFNFLKWECIFGRFPLEWEPAITLCLLQERRYFHQDTLGLAWGWSCGEYPTDVTA